MKKTKQFVVYCKEPIIVNGNLLKRCKDLFDRNMLSKYFYYNEGKIITLGDRKKFIPNSFTNMFSHNIQL